LNNDESKEELYQLGIISGNLWKRPEITRT
jgi:hypothetical protein